MSRPRRSRPNASSRLRVNGLLAAVAGALCVSAVEVVRAHEHKHTHQNLARASFRLLNSPDLVTGRFGTLTTQQIENEIAQGVIDEDECVAIDDFAPHHDWDTATNWNSHFFEAKTHVRLSTPLEVAPPGWGCNIIRINTRTTAAERAQMLYTMAKDDYRAGHYKSAFRILGRMMHLLEDMTSPAHVTDDPHGGPTDCGGDNDPFERWGYCESKASSATHRRICEYFADSSQTNNVAFQNCGSPPANECVADFNSDGQFESYGVPPAGFQCRLWAGLHILYGGRPVSVKVGANENPGFAFIRQVANVTYDFTTYTVQLVDRENGDEAQPDSELQWMLRPGRKSDRLPQCTFFSDFDDEGLCEARAGGWSIGGPHQAIGWASGDLGLSTPQNWWIMPTFYFKGDGRTEGFAYLENKGGAAEDDFIPLRYGCTVEDNALERSPCSERGLGVRSKKMYQQLYGTVQNNEDPFLPISHTGKTLLRIYGDVLYPTAVAYGAGLIQAFVDDVTMAPTADAGGPYQGEACTAITFDASKSSDSNGTIVSYAWDFTDDGTFDATTPASHYPYAYPSPFNGQARLRVTDNDGFTRETTADVVITPDVTAPVITKITATPNQLWPPNRQMTPVTIDVSLAGGCAGTCRITGVTSSDLTKGRGTGKNGGEEPDWVVTGPLTLRLRAERSGNVALRAYTVAITCVDSAGNTTTGNVVVAVPHDQRPSNRQQR
jgi:PKD domain-containing protein